MDELSQTLNDFNQKYKGVPLQLTYSNALKLKSALLQYIAGNMQSIDYLYGSDPTEYEQFKTHLSAIFIGCYSIYLLEYMEDITVESQIIETIHLNNDKIDIASANQLVTMISDEMKSMFEFYKQKKKTGGCYIATMAYGDYDHPKVMVLRHFRDDVLAKTIAGRVFVRFYYATSPKLVRILRNHEKVNSIIRKILDQFIKIIK